MVSGGAVFAFRFPEKVMSVDILSFALDYAAPATVVLISDDRNLKFAYALSVKGYATMCLDWNDVLHNEVGEDRVLDVSLTTPRVKALGSRPRLPSSPPNSANGVSFSTSPRTFSGLRYSPFFEPGQSDSVADPNPSQSSSLLAGHPRSEARPSLETGNLRSACRFHLRLRHK